MLYESIPSNSICVIYNSFNEIVGWCPTELEAEYIIEMYEKSNKLYTYDIVYDNLLFIVNNYIQMCGNRRKP
jgi:hypothetical protein